MALVAAHLHALISRVVNRMMYPLAHGNECLIVQLADLALFVSHEIFNQ